MELEAMWFSTLKLKAARMHSDDFVNLVLSTNNLDVFVVRSAILAAIKESMPYFSGRLLDIGCGRMPYRALIAANGNISEYVGLDIDNALIYDEELKPDVVWDGVRMPFDDESFDSAIGTEVLEHCPEPVLVVSEVYRVLKPGGFFFFTVPFLWPLHESPHDEYRYTPYSLERILMKAGFKDIDIEAGGGWHASMAQMLGLWTKRSPMRSWLRALLAHLMIPIVRILVSKDKRIDLSIKDQQMFTGFHGTARR